MSIAADDQLRSPTATRHRMLAVAMKLFNEYGFAGTSLQMIADELDLTKAAIYYHFRTREELLLALMAPMLSQIREVVETAERQRSARARAESMLRGYADMVSKNRLLTAVTVFDPSVGTALRNQPEWAAAVERQVALLAGASEPHSGKVNAAVVMTGLAGGASSADADLTDDVLRDHLTLIGRRILGLPIQKQ